MAVYAGRLRFVGLVGLRGLQIVNKIITFNLYHFKHLFLTVCNILRVPVISAALPFRGVVGTQIDDCAKDGGKEFFNKMHCVL